MTQRLALNLADAVKPCSFAAGETDEAPECSASLVLSACRERYDREAIRGVVDTGRYRLPYRVWGRGPALVIVPGLCDDAVGLVLPIARLSESYCCIAYDMPTGQGDGARLANHSHDDLVDDLFALVDHLRLSSAILFGVSFGTTVAMRALARDPQRFPIGMLQGGFAHRPLARAEVLLAHFARYWPGPLHKLPFWKRTIERLQKPEFESIEPARWPFFLEHNGSPPIAAVAHRALLLNRLDLRPLLPTIRQPVMLIDGDRDPIVPRWCGEELRKGLPNVAVAEIEKCGHLPQFTHPEVMCEVIEQFLTMASAK